MKKKDKKQEDDREIEITEFVKSMASEKALPPDDGSVNDYFEYMIEKHK